ncbi:hypothetical protein BT67DRAFT_413006 [Trichocladium antarcticum]|uniref:Flavin reductase like domain-containing protein n=1 Tax=Trichocladium antarcticum TaxID=1450529 RepID=A0AAN6ZI92_9PEZI|nr:hypothetical protein BT67DRAFT_413006 [Trichocladium antarcticum]
MSRRRVVLGLAAERARSLPVLGRNHGSAPARAVMRPRPVAAQPYLGFPATHLLTKPFHSTSTGGNQSHRPFTLTPPTPPSIHPAPSSPALPDQFRTLMRLLPHSVVVCTSTHPASPSSASGAPVPRAMTMSSFTSLALRPTPVVSFNIATPSRTFDAVAASRQFNIHVLADDASGARIADWLAGGNAGAREVFARLAEEGGCEMSMAEGAPVLKGAGVLYVVRCRLLDQPSAGLVRVRDHVIVLGEVVEIVEGPGAQTEVEERFGLVYADRRYRQLGGCLTKGEGVVERDEGEVVDREGEGGT